MGNVTVVDDQRCVRLMREFRPHVVTTYDEDGGYPHPDHVMCHKISVAAFDASGDPDRYPELGQPWQPRKLYYHMGWSYARMVALHEAMLAAGMESPYTDWLANWDPSRDKGHRVTTRVECGAYFEVRDDALRAHATQVDPDGFWFRVPLEIQRKAWPTEDYELVRCVVERTVPEDGPEDDLFARVTMPGISLRSTRAAMAACRRSRPDCEVVWAMHVVSRMLRMVRRAERARTVRYMSERSERIKWLSAIVPHADGDRREPSA